MRLEIIDKIKSSPEDQVNLQNMQLVDGEMSELMETVIKKRPNLTELFLDHNQLTDTGAEIVAKNLQALPSLAFITLEYNQIDQKGFTVLFDAQYKKGENTLRLALHGNLMHDVSEVEKLKNSAKNKYKK